MCNFDELTDKNVCLVVLCDRFWSKLQELYIDDSHDTSTNTLRECFTLGKGCVQILWMRHLINCYGNITNSKRFACNDTIRDRFVCQRKPYVRFRHIDVRHHFVFSVLEEKLAMFGHKTSEKSVVGCV